MNIDEEIDKKFTAHRLSKNEYLITVSNTDLKEFCQSLISKVIDEIVPKKNIKYKDGLFWLNGLGVYDRHSMESWHDAVVEDDLISQIHSNKEKLGL
jgi:hypothetical protein